MTRFADRMAAGIALARAVARFAGPDVAVLALPRGGVPVAAEIARALAAPLDLVFVRKIGAPGFEELAIGAVADGPEPEMFSDPALIRRLHVPPDWLDTAKARALAEMERRRRAYLGDRPPTPVAGRTVILVDDGLATGSSMLAAIRALRRRTPARLVIAVPVGAPASLARIAREADDVVCLHAPQDFNAVSQYYDRFPQVQDSEVIAVLDQASATRARKSSTIGQSGASGSSANS